MSITYTDLVSSISTLLQVQDSYGTAALTALMPRFIEYAELRMQREFDFIATNTVDSSQITVNGVRAVTLPTEFIVLQEVSLITPANTLPSAAGATRVPLLRTSRPFIDLTWPTESNTQAPAMFQTYYALYSESEPQNADPDEPVPLPSAIIIAPTPDDAYRVEFTGTQRQTPLSPTNASNFMSMYLPDLYIAAVMVIASGYQRDFSAQGSADPSMAISWEQQYQILRQSAQVEEARKKSQGAGWTPFLPPVVANTPRTMRSMPQAG